MTCETTPSVAERFEFIYTRFHGKIRSLVYSWLNDWAASEDLAQEVFTALWRDMSQRGLELDDVEHLYGYLAKRARWAKAAYYQALCGRREQPLQSEMLDEDAADKSHVQARAAALAADSPEASVPAKVDAWAILSRLPDKQRRVLVLRYYDDLKPDAIARVTGLKPRTVSFHTANGLNALRAAAGLPAGGLEKTRQTAESRREAMRQVYQASIDAGAPLSMAELARRFGRTGCIARKAVAGMTVPPRAVPKYQVRDHIREGLANGTYPPGSMMPTVGQLAEKFDTSDGNVNTVMRELAAQGLLVKVTGPGMGSQGRWHAAPAAPVPALVTGTYLVTGRTPTGAETFPTARLGAAA